MQIQTVVEANPDVLPHLLPPRDLGISNAPLLGAPDAA